jgi:hypothetical protein
MGRVVWAMVVTKLALIAVIYDFTGLLRGEVFRLLLVIVYCFKQRGE